MTTIDPEKTIPSIAPQKAARDRPLVGESGFDSIFKQVVTEKSAEPVGTATCLPDVQPVRFTDNRPSSAHSLVNRVQSLVETLADLQTQLSADSVSLKTMQGLIDRMTVDSEALRRVSPSVTTDAPLRRIVDRALTLTSLEIIRYYNGHYTSEPT